MDYADKLDLMDDDCDLQGFPTCKDPVVTNADHIRAMSDEELACFIDSMKCGRCFHRGNDCFPNGIEDWLRQPYKEKEDGSAT